MTRNQKVALSVSAVPLILALIAGIKCVIDALSQ